PAYAIRALASEFASLEAPSSLPICESSYSSTPITSANRFGLAGHWATGACWDTGCRFVCAVVPEISGAQTRDASRIAASIIDTGLARCKKAVLMRPPRRELSLLVRYHDYRWIRPVQESAGSLSTV